MTKRILIFGAGASNAAGYPLANDLLPSIKDFQTTNTALVQLRDAWEKWEGARNALSETYTKDLLSNPNPEVALSLLELIEIGATSSSNLHEQTAKVRSAKAALFECLKWYFTFKNRDDAEDPSRRDYLRDLLRSLDEGDVVLTLNWDTVAERTLCELGGKWNPTTGYGLDCPLHFLGSPHYSVPDAAIPRTQPSQVTVLKLHGSFGWYETYGDFYISRQVLDDFRFQYEGDNVFPRHLREPLVGPDMDPVLLYPSFLKRLSRIELREIWHKAKIALDNCDRVEIYGYSLPETDIAVRALLNDLRFRLQEGHRYCACVKPQ